MWPISSIWLNALIRSLLRQRILDFWSLAETGWTVSAFACFSTGWNNRNHDTFLSCFVSFLARDSIYAIARYMLSLVRLSVCLSVRLSVTRVNQSKTVEVRITQPSPQSSPMTLVSSRLTSPRNSKGSGGADWHRGRKNTKFSANKSPYLRNGAR